MPSKSEVVEAFLAEIEERFYATLQGDNFSDYLGGTVQISYTAKPRLTIDIHELGRPGPKVGTKFKKNPSLQAARRLQKETENYGNDANEF